MHKKPFFYWLFAALLSYTACGFTKPPIPEITLEEMVLLTLSHNPDIYGKRLDHIINKYDLAGAYYEFQPQFSVGGSTKYTHSVGDGKHNHTESYGLNPQIKQKTLLGTDITVNWNNSSDGVHYNPLLKVSVTQPLLKGFGIDINEMSLLNAEDKMKRARLQLKKQLMQTITDVIQKYRSIVRSYNSLEIQKLGFANRKRELANAKLEIKAGEKAPKSILDTETNIASQELTIAKQKNQLQQEKVTLLETVGLNPDMHYTIDKRIEIDKVDLPPLDQLISVALENNIDYQTKWLDILQEERSLRKSKDDARWQLDLKANAQTGSGSGSGRNAGIESLVNGRNRSFDIGLDLTIPIDNITNEKNIMQKTFALEKQQIELEKQKRKLTSDVMNKVKDIKFKERQIELSQRNRDIKKEVLETNTKKHEFGLISTFDLETYRSQLISAEETLVKDKIDYLNAITDLEQLLGITLERWNIQFEE